MDYKSIVKSWANDLDQQAAKDVCVQFGLIEVEDSEHVALDFEDLVKIPKVEKVMKMYKDYLGAAILDSSNEKHYNTCAGVCAEILKEVFKLNPSDLEIIKIPITESLIGKTFKEEKYLADLFKGLYNEYSSLQVYRVPLRLFFMVTLDGCPVLGRRKEWHVYADYDAKADLYTITKITER